MKVSQLFATTALAVSSLFAPSCNKPDNTPTPTEKGPGKILDGKITEITFLNDAVLGAGVLTFTVVDRDNNKSYEVEYTDGSANQNASMQIDNANVITGSTVLGSVDGFGFDLTNTAAPNALKGEVSTAGDKSITLDFKAVNAEFDANTVVIYNIENKTKQDAYKANINDVGMGNSDLMKDFNVRTYKLFRDNNPAEAGEQPSFGQFKVKLKP